MKLILATRNKGKISEFKELLKDTGFEITGIEQYPFLQEVAETGSTFAENAALKAEYVANATNILAVADDSGLAVDALNGAPGINSARFAGVHGDDQANNDKLLMLLAKVPPEQRTGRFCCAIAITPPGGATIIVEGVCEGTIASEPKGDKGFGYDPLFIPEGYKVTMGQMPDEEKNKISHRAKAVAKAHDIIGKVAKGR
ncbi:MAG: XTP/dITP diphosphatase [Bacillota bacterium]|nr:XTP/dITP diphosphatase [Bacillota bacterium]